ncbi:MAG TPA: hypothetical protein VKZ56_01570, partial [Membranihabitans sp.]|nr:hypothetical protein [Membranihabitans sp.]
MNQFPLTFLFLLLCLLPGISQQMDFEDYDPPSTLVVPGDEITRAKFPFIDVHSHQFAMPTMDLSGLIKDMDDL